MLNEALAGLAASAGTGLVSAMVTDGWQQARTRVARLLARGDAAEEERHEARLELARREVMEASGKQAEEVRRLQEWAWRTRFADLLEDEPEAQAPLRDLVAFLAEQAGPAAGIVQVNAQATDHAQQAVQGQGIQNNTFTLPDGGV
ncbi:hypothetical protein [Actinomadura sp. NPDC000929]|uniref:hypothetical protein n=1 Tax=Actinomadura sp. NPDC000929 TaxID=3154517 RepID=UPI003394542F